jgi:hypothetical protein
MAHPFTIQRDGIWDEGRRFARGTDRTGVEARAGGLLARLIPRKLRFPAFRSKGPQGKHGRGAGGFAGPDNGLGALFGPLLRYPAEVDDVVGDDATAFLKDRCRTAVEPAPEQACRVCTDDQRASAYPARIVNLIDALKRSLAAERPGGQQ